MRLELLINVPLAKPLPSANNLREHWAVKAKRVAEQRRQAGLYMLLGDAQKVTPNIRHVIEHNPSTGIVCTLTRISSRSLDSDNLQGAFKAVRDQVADTIALDDGSPRWTWKYAQESGAPGYRIHLEVTAGLLTQSEVQR